MLRFVSCALCAALLLALAEPTGLGAAEPQSRQGQSDRQRREAVPDPLVEPFLGTWVCNDTQRAFPGAEPHAVDRYLLMRWQRGRLRVKTVDYVPEVRSRALESDWKGTIIVDRWNTTQQTFTPMEDGTISVGLSGTAGIGPGAAKMSWWAAGRLYLEESEGEEEPVLRFVTTEGYAPSSKGNAWRPFDRVYRRISRGIDPRFER